MLCMVDYENTKELKKAEWCIQLYLLVTQSLETRELFHKKQQ